MAASLDELDVIAPGAFVSAVAPLFEGARGFLGRLAMARPFDWWMRCSTERARSPARCRATSNSN